MKRRITFRAACWLFVGMALAMCKQPSATEGKTEAVADTMTVETPEDAIAKLMAGNARYVEGKSIHPHDDLDRLKETAPNQEPYAAVVGCSDSREPVELLFDQGVGDVFVIRTAGNNVNGHLMMGSVEYAVEHLGVKLLMVLGHESCGGVTGAISGEEEEGQLGKLLTSIRNDVPQYVGKSDSLEAAIRLHTRVQVERIMANPAIVEKIKEGKLAVKSAYYNIHTGKVVID